MGYDTTIVIGRYTKPEFDTLDESEGVFLSTIATFQLYRTEFDGVKQAQGLEGHFYPICISGDYDPLKKDSYDVRIKIVNALDAIQILKNNTKIRGGWDKTGFLLTKNCIETIKILHDNNPYSERSEIGVVFYGS